MTSESRTITLVIYIRNKMAIDVTGGNSHRKFNVTEGNSYRKFTKTGGNSYRNLLIETEIEKIAMHDGAKYSVFGVRPDC